MSDLKESLKTKLREVKADIQKDATNANLLESVQTDVTSLKEDNVMAASLIEKSLKENTTLLTEHEILKEEVGKFGDILDKILELIMEFREEGNEGEEEEMIEEESTTPESTPETSNDTMPTGNQEEAVEKPEEEIKPEDKTMKEEIKEEIIEEIKEELKPEEKTETQPKPPVQMESGLKGVKNTITENVVAKKIKGEKSLANLF